MSEGADSSSERANAAAVSKHTDYRKCVKGHDVDLYCAYELCFKTRDLEQRIRTMSHTMLTKSHIVMCEVRVLSFGDV